MGYYRRKKRPSEYRFLAELYPTACALLFAFMLTKIPAVLCAPAAMAGVACNIQFPNYVWLGLLAAGLYGIAASAYRFYRDFYLGEYWLDLER
jgi:hypothetical protein